MGVVVAVAARGSHRITKDLQDSINLISGHGVERDAHSGSTVKHRSRVAKDPTQPNLRQVHLIHAELFEMLAGKGFSVGPAMMGENITTRGIDLLGLSVGTRLRLGENAVIEVTGLRNPCHQLNGLIPGLMNAVLDHSESLGLIRLAGVMAIVTNDGIVRAGDRVEVACTPQLFVRLQPV